MPETKSKEQVKAEMDAAADIAFKQLEGGNIERMTARELANWVAANYMAAGYKRLGRILVAFAKTGPQTD